MPREARKTPKEVGPNKMQEHPATEIAAALGLNPNSFDYTGMLALKEKLVDVCKRCAIRFGLPNQSHKYLGDAIGLPDEPLLRYPPPEIPMDPRWEALATALRFPSSGDLPLVNLAVANAHVLATLIDSLPSLLKDLDLQQYPRHGSSGRPRFHPITREVGEQLVDNIARVQAFGDRDDPSEESDRALALNINRQMRIYKEIGPEWTLVTSLESLALTSCALPQPTERSSQKESKGLATSAQPRSAARRNLTGEEPKNTPPPLPGLTWMWVKHEGSDLPLKWGGPQDEEWGRWEPQFLKTTKHNTSLFGQSSVYLTKDLADQPFRESPTRRLLTKLLAARLDFEQTRHDARGGGYLSENFESSLRARLIQKQDAALDLFIAKHKK